WVLTFTCSQGTDDFADLLSRMQQQDHEWELLTQVLLPQFFRWGFPQIGLFATTQNAQTFPP
ncbi:hypothetical protein NDU88_000480, partial [Pleurodeles waltl]